MAAAQRKRNKQKRPTLLRDLRQRIVGGDWKPGEKLPSREVFEQMLGASRVTVQRVFDKLVQEGFVEVNGRRDTRIALEPPHLTRYALAFPTNPSSSTIRWNRFWGALHDVSMNLRRSDDSATVLPFFNIDGHQDVHDYQQLLLAMRHHLVAGIIFPSYPSEMLLKSPLMKEPGIPRVVIAANLNLADEYKVSTVDLDNTSFFMKACEYLRHRDCRTVGLILPAGLDIQRHVLPVLAQYELSCPPYWMHRLQPASAEVVSSIVQLMLRNSADRPQGLIVANDHFADPATQGLIASGLRVPEQIPVVFHENFPSTSVPLLKVQRLGFDARQVIKACMDLIDPLHPFDHPVRTAIVKARFEFEVV